jgi:hypothetical protein
MKPLEHHVRTRYRILFFGVFLLIVPILFLYSAGYRFDKDWRSLVRTGGIYIYSNTDVRISVNDSEARETNFFRRGIFVQELKPGTYSVIAEKDGYQSWSKQLPVEASRVTEASAFLVRTSPILEIVSTSTATSTQQLSYLSGLFRAASSTKLVAKEKEQYRAYIATSSRSIHISTDMATSSLPGYFCVIACTKDIIVYTPSGTTTQPIHFDFFPNRDDVVVVQTVDGIYAYEIDVRSPQNSYQIFPGKAEFVISDEVIYIRTNTGLYRVVM